MTETSPPNTNEGQASPDKTIAKTLQKWASESANNTRVGAALAGASFGLFLGSYFLGDSTIGSNVTILSGLFLIPAAASNFLKEFSIDTRIRASLKDIVENGTKSQTFINLQEVLSRPNTLERGPIKKEALEAFGIKDAK